MADAPLRILVVEDHAALGRFIIAALRTLDCTVLGPIADRAAAIEAVQRLPWDLALLDWMLQGEEAAAIVEAARARGLPCVLMSGNPPWRLPERLRDLPFLEKPFTTEALLETLRGALGGLS